ncbi:MAG TPA: cytochrome c oxidase subunit I, partial [Rhodopila sp.]
MMAATTEAQHDHGHGDDHAHDHKPTFITRWFFSTNHKDIGTLYLAFSLFTVLFGLVFSIIMRAELQAPGQQFIQDGQV